MDKKIDIRFIILIAILAVVGIWRVVSASIEMTAWTNFSPVGAMALFAGYYFMNRSKAYITPVLVLLISDIVLMNTLFADFRSGLLYDGWYWTYGSFLLMVVVGELFKTKKPLFPVLLGSLIAGSVHFLISNFGVWIGGGLDITGMPYTRDFSGLIKCYTQALPFFRNLLYGNLIFSGILFGAFELAQAKFPKLRPATNG